MERPIKGGYILISLGLIALSTSYNGSIDYDKISRTKKHIVLTGIKVGDTVMPDVCVKPVYGNGTITFEDVYGFDIVVSSNNSVAVSQHVLPPSGTKLYKHLVKLRATGFSWDIIFISPSQFEINTMPYFETAFMTGVISVGPDKYIYTTGCRRLSHYYNNKTYFFGDATMVFGGNGYIELVDNYSGGRNLKLNSVSIANNEFSVTTDSTILGTDITVTDTVTAL